MKNLLCVITTFLCFLGAVVSAHAEQSATKELTLMVYMCGSNLQSQNNCAAVDMGEMENSGMDPDEVNLLVLTGGANMKDWTALSVNYLEPFTVEGETYGDFQSQHAENFGSNMGDASTLSNYIRYCIEQYPAKQYALILWDHGEGPLGHICHDECNGNDGLSIAELAEALKNAELPQKLSWIGFDACLMSTAEVALAVSPYAEYMIASQETEPETGWNYRCLKGIEEDENGAAAGKRIIEAYREGNSGVAGITLSCLDLSKIQDVVGEMDAFFKPLAESLDKASFIRLSELRDSSTHFGEVVRSVDNGYDLVDLESLVEQFGAFEDASGLKKALKNAVVENDSNMEGAAGLSVYHPYYNKDAYLTGRGDQYRNLPFSEGYRQYVERFGAMLTGRAFADWSGIQLRDGGAVQNAHSFSLQMTEEQRQNYASAQLIILGAIGNASDTGIYESQLLIEDDRQVECYYPVWVGDASNTPGGLLSSVYTSRSLYLTDENGTPLAGPIGYRLSDDGSQIYIFAQYQDNSGREDASPVARVIYTCTVNPETDELTVVNTAVYDSVTQSYTRRLGFDEKEYTDLYIDRLARCVPESDGALPAFADWINVRDSIELALPLTWRLRFFDTQLSGTQLYATMQVTDTQQNSYCTPLIPVENPNLYDIDFSPRTISGDGFELEIYAVLDDAPLQGGLNIGFRLSSGHINFKSVIINDTYDVTNNVTLIPVSAFEAGPQTEIVHIGSEALIGIDCIDTVTFRGSGGYIQELTLHFRDCQLSVSPESPHTLSCEVEQDNILWQIYDLALNAQGDLEGLLHIRNDSDMNLSEKYNISVNDRIQTDEVFSMSVLAHTENYHRIVIRNNTFLSDFAIAGSDSQNRLAAFYLMQRAGVEQVKKLKLMPIRASNAGTLSFCLDAPLRLPALDAEISAQALTDLPRESLLLDGNIPVWVERVFSGHDEIGLLLRIHNTLDRDTLFSIKHFALNGQTLDNYPIPAKNNGQIKLGTGCEAVIALKINDGMVKEKITEIGLAFRYDGFTTRRACIRLNPSVIDHTDENVYISNADYSIDPIAYGKPGMICKNPWFSFEGGSVKLSIELANSSDDSLLPVEESDDPASLYAHFTIANYSEKTKSYSLSNFRINDSRSITASISKPMVHGSEVVSDSQLIIVNELLGIEEIRSISCEMTIHEWEGDSTIVPLRWTFEDFGLLSLVPANDLGHVWNGDTEWRLLSIDVEEQPKLTTTGGFLFTFSVTNHASQDYICEISSLLAEGIYGITPSTELRVGGHTGKVITLTFPNHCDLRSKAVRLDDMPVDDWYDGCLLQSCGYDTLQELALLLKETGTADYKLLQIPLAEAWPLPAPNEDERRNMRQQKLLADGDATVGISYLGIYDNGFALTLSMRNNTDENLRIELKDPLWDKHALNLADPGVYMLPPRGTLIENVCFILPASDVYGEVQGDLSFYLHIGEAEVVPVKLRSDIPFLMGSGFRVPSAELYCSPLSGSWEEIVEHPVFTPEDFDLELGFLPCRRSPNFDPLTMEDNEKADISRFCAEQAILENLKPGEYYEPAFRIINHSGQKADLSVCGIVNGKSYQWARVSVPDNESYLSYARTKERSLLASSDIAAFDCMLYVNAVPCMSGVIEIQTDSTAAENTIVFGSYEQDGDPNNGPEGIEWLVLDEHDGKRLLVSRYALAREQMIEKAGTYHWEDSSLRIWLNQVFYETAFIESERAQILLSTIDNKSCENTPFGNTGGTFITTLMDLNQRKDDPDTQDHVFLLSYEELVSFFPEEGSRRCRTSALFGSEACEWWLRSPNLKNSAVITVAVAGNTNVNSGIGSVFVRPALWITG